MLSGLLKENSDLIVDGVLLFICSCFYFWKILLRPDQLIYAAYSDTLRQFYPWHFFTAETLKRGQLPLWLPYVCSGEPFIANIQAAVFYPLNVLMLFIFPVHLAIGYNYLLHIFFTGLFTYLFARYIKLDRASSLLSSITFMFCGFFAAHIFAGHYSIITTACWLPLIFLFFEIALKTNDLFHGITIGVLIGLSFLAGSPQIFVYILFALGLYLLFRLFLMIRESKEYREALKSLAIYVLALVAGLSLAAAQLLPSLELSQYTTRAGGVSYSFATSFSFSPQYLITLILPNFFGNPINDTYWGDDFFWEFYPYLGFLPLILAVIAVYFKRDNKHVQFFTMLGLLSLLLALGKNTPIYWLLWRFIPGFNLFRCPSRFLFLFSFSISMLSGFGFIFLREGLSLFERAKIMKLIKALTVFTLLLICVVIIASVKGQQIIQYGQEIMKQKYYATPHPQPLNYYLRKIPLIYLTIMKDLFTLLVLSTSTVLIFALWIKKISTRCFNVAVILLILLNLWSYHVMFINARSPSEIYKETAYISFLKNHCGYYRIYDAGGKILDNFQVIYKIYDIGGYNPLVLRDYLQILHCVRSLSNCRNHPILSLLNVKYILTTTRLDGDKLKLVFHQNDVYIYENEEVLPKAFVLHNVKILPRDEIIRELKDEDFNPLDAVLLEQEQVLVDNHLAWNFSNKIRKSSLSLVEVEHYSPTEIILKTNLTSPGFLVLSEIYYPGWEVYVDGERQTILRAYYVFRAVYLSKGQHVIKFVYNPASLRTGLYITFFALFLLTIVCMGKWILSRRHVTSSRGF